MRARDAVAMSAGRTAVMTLLRGWLLGWLLLLTPVVHADGVDIVQAHLESTDEGVKLSATFAFDLNRGLEDAITHGLPLYFTTEIEMKRPRWYWFDENTITESQTIRLSYNVLTRQYHAAILGRLQQSFSSLDEALSLIRRPSRWLVAENSSLKSGAVYSVSVRMRLDVAQLAKPFQVNAINNADWRLSSDWKTFLYKAE
ncbi:DUF4390 domain-containing protein [Actimicrobium sp. CCI2.3]|uniref:DUF4390 domain-containing protein n=1 Tax=Actimicrobium sp. CCI2.3 TaxID=3048616 RepID=UPI002AB37501|nr:DUF4390 domain-containing protein [Actimicrobium sp. CCI2.3]MDY7576501.1 DUF4390 domain-containing protein [Actimicrobium sp. CCI2.3]MEB0021521.1 DUF4390 domain-containing protein [Actimicrobium sp. CCI2.3]